MEDAGAAQSRARPAVTGGHRTDSGYWKNWKLRKDEDGILWLVIDKAGASANVLSADVIAELDDVLGHIEREPAKGLVLRSGKPGGFIAGADVNELRDIKTASDMETRLTQGHAIVDRLDRLKLPTVAVIHGYCLGGGLEVALACDYRIATEDASLGFRKSCSDCIRGSAARCALPSSSIRSRR